MLFRTVHKPMIFLSLWDMTFSDNCHVLFCDADTSLYSANVSLWHRVNFPTGRLRNFRFVRHWIFSIEQLPHVAKSQFPQHDSLELLLFVIVSSLLLHFLPFLFEHQVSCCPFIAIAVKNAVSHKSMIESENHAFHVIGQIIQCFQLHFFRYSPNGFSDAADNGTKRICIGTKTHSPADSILK